MKVLLVFIFMCCFIGLSQPNINQRYTLNYDASIFGSVVATDSCYYVSGMGANSFGTQYQEGAFVKINFDGSLNNQKMYQNDTLEIVLWETPNLIKTLDNNFAQIGVTHYTDFIGYNTFFIKFKPNGDTIFTKTYNQFYLNDNNWTVSPSIVIQNSDSTYFCSSYVFNDLSNIGKVIFFKLSKHGDLLWYKYFTGISSDNYNILRPKSLLRYDMNKILIGCSLIHPGVYNNEFRSHTKLIMVDTLGNLLWQRTYTEDTLNFYCNGLTKTTNGDVLYCGKNGEYWSSNNSLNYKSHITKLDADFNVEWRIHLGVFSSESFTLNNIKSINNTEFVAVGNTHSYFYENDNNYDFTTNGWLIKFNINGDILWQRKYTNVPHFITDNNNYAEHILYDVDITIDSGFVMVGQARNLVSNNGYGGQQGWLVKVDKHGCLVPNCQQYDNVDTTTTDTTDIDTTIMVSEPVELYPNPANTSLYYYHTQADTSQNQTAYMYNLQGQLVQQFSLTDTNLTYIIDVTNFANGVYIFVIKNELGEILRSDKAVIQH